jgi:BTB/POZ domain
MHDKMKPRGQTSSAFMFPLCRDIVKAEKRLTFSFLVHQSPASARIVLGRFRTHFTAVWSREQVSLRQSLPEPRLCLRWVGACRRETPLLPPSWSFSGIILGTKENGGFDFVVLACHCPSEEKFTTRLVCLGLSRNDSDVWWDTPAFSVDMQLFCSVCDSERDASDRTSQSTTSHNKEDCILRGFGSKVLEVGVFIKNKVPAEYESIQLCIHHLRSGLAKSEVHTVTCRVTVSLSNVTSADAGQHVPFQNNPDLSHAHVLLQGHDSDENVLAQRSVLTAHRKYFQAMFRNNGSNESLVEGQPIVKLKSIGVSALRIAIGHMYGKDLPVRLWDCENWKTLFELWTFSI